MKEPKDKWFKYLSKQKDADIRPTMSEFFNNKINFEELNGKICECGLQDFYTFRKELIIEELLLEVDN